MELLTVKNGVLKKVPADHEFRHATKYILIFFAGIVLGIIWRSFQG